MEPQSDDVNREMDANRSRKNGSLTDDPRGPESRRLHYWAFISYCHSDRLWAEWLHSRLESFTIPRNLRGHVPDRLNRKHISPIFIDEAELPAGHSLRSSITSAIDGSLCFIVVASPGAVRSPHVTAEIEYFVGRHGRERVLTIIVAGHPNAAYRGHSPAEECFPEVLRHSTMLNGVADIPYAADARGGRAKSVQAIRRVAAGVLGVGYETLYRRDMRRLTARVGISALAATALAVFLLVPYGLIERLEFSMLGYLSKELPERLRGKSDPWVGTWLGHIASTCGNYSGPLTDVIEVAGPGLLRLEYNAGGMLKGSYNLAYSGARAVSNEIPGSAYFSLQGSTIKINYPRTCQTATLTKAKTRS